MRRKIFHEQIGPFLLRAEHDPDIPDVIWRSVTCTICERVLASGTLAKEGDNFKQGIEDLATSMKHACQPN